MTRVGSVFPCVILLVCCAADLSKAGDELWAGGWSSDNVVRFEAQGGAFLGEFVAAGRGGLNAAHHFSFGPDGHFYVASYFTSSVMRYDGATGEPLPGPLGAGGTAQFVPPGSGGLDFPLGIAFGPDQNLYVASFVNSFILRYDGRTGAFMDIFAKGRTGRPARAHRAAFLRHRR